MNFSLDILMYALSFLFLFHSVETFSFILLNIIPIYFIENYFKDKTFDKMFYWGDIVNSSLIGSAFFGSIILCLGITNAINIDNSAVKYLVSFIISPFIMAIPTIFIGKIAINLSHCVWKGVLNVVRPSGVYHLAKHMRNQGFFIFDNYMSSRLYSVLLRTSVIILYAVIYRTLSVAIDNSYLTSVISIIIAVGVPTSFLYKNALPNLAHRIVRSLNSAVIAPSVADFTMDLTTGLISNLCLIGGAYVGSQQSPVLSAFLGSTFGVFGFLFGLICYKKKDIIYKKCCLPLVSCLFHKTDNNKTNYDEKKDTKQSNLDSELKTSTNNQIIAAC